MRKLLVLLVMLLSTTAFSVNIKEYKTICTLNTTSLDVEISSYVFGRWVLYGNPFIYDNKVCQVVLKKGNNSDG